jgi:cytochrome c
LRRAVLTFALAAALLGAPFAGASAAGAQPVDPAVDRGSGVAQRQCVECHAVRPGRHSADGDAPPFTVLRLRYNEISLARRIAAVTKGEHAGMPPTSLSDADRKDLVSYIESLGSEVP